MVSYRCKCGKRTYSESGMPPHPCMGCHDCKTTFATHPDGHERLQEHQPKTTYSQQTGEPEFRVCAVCHTTLARIL